jgi:uncharacterized membrane protein
VTQDQPSQRLDAIDALRGLALLGMFAFHLIWDLGYFELVSPELPYEPAIMGFGHGVAGSFLFLVGASLALASQHGVNMWAFWRRLLVISAAAAGVSAATYLLFPQSFIFFGILHCIALSSLLALPLLRAPLWLVAMIALAALVAPLLIESTVFDAPAFWWLGLGTREPLSNDWRPLLPYFGVVLAGLTATRWLLARGLPAGLTNWRAQTRASAALVWGGRHSLLVYLVHQPVFLAVLFMVARVVTPQAALAPQDDPFVASCTAQCVATSGGQQACRNVCLCISGEIRKEPMIWQRLMNEGLSPADRVTIDGFTRQCIAKSR